MGLSVLAAISNSILPSCIPSLLSSRDVIVAEGYSVSYSSKRATGGKEPGRALFCGSNVAFGKGSLSAEADGETGRWKNTPQERPTLTDGPATKLQQGFTAQVW